MALIRPALLAFLIYAGYAVAYPDYVGTTYHVMVLSTIMGGAVGLFLLKELLDLGEGAAKLALELIFLAAIAAFVGYTMPQKSGKAPLTQWAAGARPTQDGARKGLRRLGVNPDGYFAAKVASFFPKR